MSVPQVRLVAAAAAVVTAVLYLLIGFEVLWIGEARSGANDILAFGLTAGAAFFVVALVVWFARRRWVLALVALFDALVVVAYFAVSGVREPPFEPWGLLVKVCQIVLLSAVGYLLVRGRRAQVREPAIMPGMGGL